MKNKKNIILHLVSLGILCAGYLLTRYILFDLHGMKQWPLVLFVCGIVVMGASFLAKAEQVPVFTALSYTGGFFVGAGGVRSRGRKGRTARPARLPRPEPAGVLQDQVTKWKTSIAHPPRLSVAERLIGGLWACC